ncbi:MAG: GSCFA domain-containing protein [Lepagella sp.]
MKFRTEYTASAEPDFALDYSAPLLLLGSCFADNIGRRLLERGWKALVNPCGVLYNPLSIARAIEMALDEAYTPQLLTHPVSGLAYCFDFSTKFSHQDSAQARAGMLDALSHLRQGLVMAQTLCVTFGTSWVFERADTGCVVANCHKLPAATFRRRCCSIAEMTTLWKGLLARLRTLNPQLRIILTVSPVRHLADGFEGNARSKARLLLLCEALAEEPGVSYFPAYEILTDDLRDYRFYADDLTHPSDMAADYIFARFADTYIPPATHALMASALKASRRSLHRPIIG